MTLTKIALNPGFFGESEREFARLDELAASLFRYDTGVEAVRLFNGRGHVILLPYLGQMIWDAQFDGVRLGMKSMFAAPRRSETIIGTYGCLAFHSGLLRNGCPSPEDDHPLHGEMPCAPMDRAGLEAGEDADGPFIRLTGEREYVMGFGDHYRARPTVTLRAGATLFDVTMAVENLAGRPMDLMYMCHANFAFAEGARFVQPAPFTPERTVARTVIPGHVRATPDYRALIAELARNPAALERLDEPQRYDPEQVFYIRLPGIDRDGLTHFLLRRREGDGFAIAYDPASFPTTVRWVLNNADQSVAAFAMPATCEPEGYLAEKAKGNVRTLDPNAEARFAVRLGYLDRPAAERQATFISSL
jgi:hypothetical protein